MTSISGNPVRLLPLGLVLLAHALLLMLSVRNGASAARPVPVTVIEASLLPAEPALPVPPASPVRNRPSPPRLVPAGPVRSASQDMVAPSQALAPDAVAPTASAAPPPSVPALSVSEPADAELVPPHADATRVGNSPPSYPPLSRRLGEQGQVVLSLHVLADGSLGQLLVKQSSGYRRLDEAAIAAVRTWRFIPAMQGGTPVAAWYLQPVSFSLRDAR